MDTDDRRTAARQLLEVLPRVMRQVAAELWRAEPPLAHSHLRALRRLVDGPRNLRELAEDLGVSLPTMSKTVSTLSERGWVSRVEAEHDRRMVRLELTPSGRIALGRIHARAVRQVSRLLESVSASDGETLLAGLAVLTRALAQEEPAREPAEEISTRP